MRKTIPFLAAGFLTATFYPQSSNPSCKEPKPLTPITPFHSKKFKSRQQHIEEVQKSPSYDVVVIGGGCNGSGVLLDSATRGFKTLLIEKEDFGSGASSKSTKLIHGGVRYLQQVFAFDTSSIKSRMEKFQLVKEAIYERSYMIKNAEYLSEKIPFVIPSTNIFKTMYYYAGSVVYYMIYWYYAPKNHISFNFPTFMNRTELREHFPYISDKYSTGVVYEDGSFNDARVNLSAILTATEGNGQHQDGMKMPLNFIKANALNRAEFVGFVKNSQGKITGVIFKDLVNNGKQITVQCKHVVNCAGAWGDKIRQIDNPEATPRLIHVAGSHITYDQKIGSSKYGLTLPSKDGRVTLVVPWLNRTIAGTTEKTFEEPTSTPTCSVQEREFINEAMIGVMEKLEPKQLFDFEKARWTGLRPLVSLTGDVKNTKDISRSHYIERSDSGLVSLMGGKWTIFRKMGADVVDRIIEVQSQGSESGVKSRYPSTQTKLLPLVGSASKMFMEQLQDNYGVLGTHLYKNYGSRSQSILHGDLTPLIGPLSPSELRYIIRNEMPTCPEDVLIRRTRAAFLLEKQKLFKLIPLVCQMMIDEGVVKLEKGKTVQQYVEETAERMSELEFS